VFCFKRWRENNFFFPWLFRLLYHVILFAYVKDHAFIYYSHYYSYYFKLIVFLIVLFVVSSRHVYYSFRYWRTDPKPLSSHSPFLSHYVTTRSVITHVHFSHRFTRLRNDKQRFIYFIYQIFLPFLSLLLSLLLLSRIFINFTIRSDYVYNVPTPV